MPNGEKMTAYKRHPEKEIKKKELKYNWDRVNNRKILKEDALR